MKKIILTVGGIVGLMLLACIIWVIVYAIKLSSDPEFQASMTVTAIARATDAARPTNTPQPTKTARPTATPKLTNTIRPTTTPKPTNTIRPSDTPKPTNTSLLSATPKTTASPQLSPSMSAIMTVTPESTVQPMLTVQVVQNANLRNGPGTNFAVAGALSAGQTITIIARNQAGDWFQTTEGTWIFGELVKCERCSSLAVVASQSATTAPQTKPPVSNSPSPTKTKLVVAAGELAKYADVYSSYSKVYVYKKNGTLDDRENDIEELCLDWLFYRNRIITYVAQGDTKKADEARVAFQQVNFWLSEYDQRDVDTMFAWIEQAGGKSIH